jgi:hypothetical protein
MKRQVSAWRFRIVYRSIRMNAKCIHQTDTLRESKHTGSAALSAKEVGGTTIVVPPTLENTHGMCYTTP